MMRDLNKQLHLKRVRHGTQASDESFGNNGAFVLFLGPKAQLYIVASDGEGWEHVSVSASYKTASGKVNHRTPTWAEMCRIKRLCFENDETVVQYHPPEADYVNNHPHCLHLWRPVGIELPRPPKEMVGIQELGEMQ